MIKISILGSTGSIGTQTLDVVRNHGDKISVVAITGNENIDLLEKQALEFQPEIVAVWDEKKAGELRKRLQGKCEVLEGLEGLSAAAAWDSAQRVVTAIPGMAGLIPTIEAIKKGKDIALANKETLVAGGSVVMNLAKAQGVELYPVDSEHSAIFQCLIGNQRKYLSKISLTASGGPFRDYDIKQLEGVTVEQALKHPNWSMGKKVTIDSSTLMNKGLEVIEAKWLFDLKTAEIDVIIHPQSIIHSLVEFKDHSSMAQLGEPDMRVAIQLALLYPERHENNTKSLNLAEIGTLEFRKPDVNKFRCLKLAYDALEAGGSMPVVLNGANEIMVDKFLNKEISFLDIPKIIESVMNLHVPIREPGLEEILEIDRWARKHAKEKAGIIS
ncbi:1-deoxy-D-xylulose-5-phosphate reductoisomerase [Alkalibacter saccharofermentans]|uniref:1-deoxy-D-xylulose 5-phosphate reductoisomerase n=1 Tax=Alkalibacter saccharofermentans DSM 14828 TaxID=1120975 RepID=A0A1M4V446_9FIRM|nr:1-deoxy-D-xylulose-5-phosphate reductoisomerase [Alkalibacter saccharofermentans]SHE63658.1 1-deoxy-D-xylulose 5-phosphate reductoisomerase [Alkalibacter saccharofermentans DSM 14828]